MIAYLKKSKIVLLCCTLTLLMFACRSKVASSDKDVVARIGNQEVSAEELKVALNKVPERRRKELKGRVLNNLIEVKFFSQEARKAGLDKNPQIQKKMAKVTNETLARSFARKYLDKQPSQEEIKKYYLEHKDKFVIPESVLIQHIVVQSRQRAEKVLQALKAGKSFEDLAKQKSICRCWKTGGHHGWLFKGRMGSELEKAALTLGKDKISDIIKTSKGYQIIKVLDKRDEKTASLKEAGEHIRSSLFRKRKNELIQKYYQEAGVDFHPAEAHVLARIGKETITDDTLAPILAKVSEKAKDQLREKWIHYLVETRVFSREARKVKLANDPEVAIELKRKTDQVLANAFRKRFITDKIKISDQDINEYYQSHHEAFQMPLKLRVRCILVKTLKEAESILKELKNGAPFGETAMRKSIHPSAPRAGEIGWFGQGEKEPMVEKTALSLKKGEMSGVIKTKSGYEIIKLMDKKGGYIKPLDEVKQVIKMNLMRQRVKKEKNRYYQQAGLWVRKPESSL